MKILSTWTGEGGGWDKNWGPGQMDHHHHQHHHHHHYHHHQQLICIIANNSPSPSAGPSPTSVFMARD
eukprot:4777646-Amphidinium_carterae.1